MDVINITEEIEKCIDTLSDDFLEKVKNSGIYYNVKNKIHTEIWCVISNAMFTNIWTIISKDLKENNENSRIF